MTACRMRAGDRMKARLADAFWELLLTTRLADVSVGSVVAKAQVSRGSFYYHFDGLDELVGWALAREIADADGEGTSLMTLAMRPGAEDGRANPSAVRSLGRICLLMDGGGMNVVYDVVLRLMVDLWLDVLRPEGGELPVDMMAQLEYAVGGTMCMLYRARGSSAEKRRISVAFLRDRHVRFVARVAKRLGVDSRELAARVEEASRARTLLVRPRVAS